METRPTVTRIPGPSRHLSWNELACWNRTQRVISNRQPGELVAAYPQEWRETRAVQLAITFEEIRQLLGNKPIRITSAYRTPVYNRAVSGANSSQHTQGRALDLTHPIFNARDLYAAIVELQKGGKLPFLGGVGSYQTFVHVDVRAKLNGHLATWRE